MVDAWYAEPRAGCVEGTSTADQLRPDSKKTIYISFGNSYVQRSLVLGIWTSAVEIVQAIVNRFRYHETWVAVGRVVARV